MSGLKSATVSATNGEKTGRASTETTQTGNRRCTKLQENVRIIQVYRSISYVCFSMLSKKYCCRHVLITNMN